jgi:hypothetical protein
MISTAIMAILARRGEGDQRLAELLRSWRSGARGRARSGDADGARGGLDAGALEGRMSC